MALVELDQFEETWGSKYPLIIRSWRSNWDEFATFFRYLPEIRKLIYTTNIIESYHCQLRKVTKGKSMYPRDESLLKMLYLATMDVMRKWTGRVQNWGQMLLQLSVFYPGTWKNERKSLQFGLGRNCKLFSLQGQFYGNVTSREVAES